MLRVNLTELRAQLVKGNDLIDQLLFLSSIQSDSRNAKLADENNQITLISHVFVPELLFYAPV